MIGLDTNILVRYLVQDHLEQARLAGQLIESGDTFFINQIVLCELVWVLVSCYDLDKQQIIAVLEKILVIHQFKIENSDLARKALEDFKDSKSDFSDCLIGRANQAYGCKMTASFDKNLKKLDSFTVL